MLEINNRAGSQRIVSGDKVSSADGVPVQAEKGEVVVTSTGEIANVAATKRHSEMDDDEITDVLEEGAYVLSDAEDGSMNITREEAEAVSLGMGISYFDELGTSKSGVEKTLADFFPKGVDELTPAELGKRIRNKYPLNNREDSYSKITNLENKKHREDALLQLVSLNESKRPKMEDAFEVQEDESMDIAPFKFGGKIMSTGGFATDPPVRSGDPIPLSSNSGGLFDQTYMDEIQEEKVDRGTLYSDNAEDLLKWFDANIAPLEKYTYEPEASRSAPITPPRSNQTITVNASDQTPEDPTLGLPTDGYDPEAGLTALDTRQYNVEADKIQEDASSLTSLDQPTIEFKQTPLQELQGEIRVQNIQGTPTKVEDDPTYNMTDLEKRFYYQQMDIKDKLAKVQDEYSKIITDSTERAKAGVEDDLQKYIENIKKAHRVFNRQSTVGLMANLAINAAQNPNLDTVDLTDQINAAKAELDRTPEYMKEYQTKGLAAQARNNAEMMFQNTNQFNRAASNLAATNAKISNALSDIAVGNNQKEIDQYNKKVSTIGALRSKQDMFDVDTANKERANVNTKIAAYGNSLENYLGELKMSGMMKTNAINTAEYQASNAMKQLDAREDFVKLRGNQLEQLDLNEEKLRLDAQKAAEQNRFNPFRPNYFTPGRSFPGSLDYQGISQAGGKSITADGKPIDNPSYATRRFPFDRPIMYQIQNGDIDRFVKAMGPEGGSPLYQDVDLFEEARQVPGSIVGGQTQDDVNDYYLYGPQDEKSKNQLRANSLLAPVSGGVLPIFEGMYMNKKN